MKTLEEILQIAENGYIDSYERIDGIMTELIDKPMGEILCNVSPIDKKRFEIVTDCNDIPNSLIDKLSFADYICLTLNIKKQIKKGQDLEDITVYILKELLLQAKSSDLLIGEFLSINIYDYMLYLEGKHDDLKVRNLYSQIECNAKRDLFRRDNRLEDHKINIGDFLKITEKAEDKSWLVWTDINSYRLMIETAFDMDKELLLGMISLAYRERMNAKDLIARYACDQPTDIEDFLDYMDRAAEEGKNH
ncbi:MAG: hypothetical protein K6G03_05170 [Lachnospiraceae bacterium]|nr:hypothetical protein [Lachnospiraceae bacterium]